MTKRDELGLENMTNNELMVHINGLKVKHETAKSTILNKMRELSEMETVLKRVEGEYKKTVKELEKRNLL